MGTEDDIVDQGLGLMPKDSPQESQQPQIQQPEPQQDKINPAWSELLEVVPEGLRGVVTPHLKKWDENYQNGLQKVHSQYEPYKPFLESGVDPEALNNAMLIMQSLEDNPENFAKALVEHYGLNLGGQGQVEAGQEQSEEEIPFDLTQIPEFQRVQQGFELLAQQTLAQNEAAQVAQEEAKLDQDIAAAKEKFGDFDEPWVYKQMYTTNCDVETAVQQFIEFREKLIQNYQSPGTKAPRLMGSGGGLPSQATPVGQMTGQQRRALMVQTLNQLKASGG